MIGWESLVARLEIENFAVAPGPGGTAPEELAAAIPVGENKVVGLGNVETLAVDLLLLQFEVFRYALGDWVGGTEVIDPCEVYLPPLQVAAGTKQVAEGL